jgi:hypothetical protein
MHQRRWTKSGLPGALADEDVQYFHRDVARQLSKRGWLFLAFLRIDGERRAVVHGFRFERELGIYLTGMDESEDLRRLSLGRVLAGMCMERAVSEGLSVYDFMRGQEAYKYELGAINIDNRTVTFFGSRSAFAAEKHRAVLLRESLERRAHQELVMWRHTLDAHGAVSREGAVVLAHRVAQVVQDGLQKWREPEKSLTAPRAPRVIAVLDDERPALEPRLRRSS